MWETICLDFQSGSCELLKVETVFNMTVFLILSLHVRALLVESFYQRAGHLAIWLSPHLHPDPNQTLRTYDVEEGGVSNFLQMLISLTLHLSSCRLQGPTPLQSIIYRSDPRNSGDHSLVAANTHKSSKGPGPWQERLALEA